MKTIKNWIRIVIAGIVLSLPAGCLDGASDDMNVTSLRRASKIKVSPSMAPMQDAPATKSLYGGNDEAIFNWAILQYEDGLLVGKSYRGSGGDIAVSVVSGHHYDFYALANVGNVISGLALGSAESDLVSFRVSPNVPEGLPMACFEPDVSFRAEEIREGAELSLMLVRLVGRYDIRVSQSGLSKWSFRATSLTTVGAATVTPFSEGSKALSYGMATNDAATEADLAALCSGSATQYYPLENCYGNLLPSNENPARKIPGQVVVDNPDANPTYIEIGGVLRMTDGSALEKEVTYRFYLGENATTNFTVARNVTHTVTLNLTDAAVDGEPYWKVETGPFDDIRSLAFSQDSYEVPAGTPSIPVNVVRNPASLKYIIEMDANLSAAGVTISGYTTGSAWDEDSFSLSLPADIDFLQGNIRIRTLDGEHTDEAAVTVGRTLTGLSLGIWPDADSEPRERRTDTTLNTVKGKDFHIHAYAAYSDGTEEDVTALLAHEDWSVSPAGLVINHNPHVAADRGRFTTPADSYLVGTTTVTASYTERGVTETALATITLRNYPVSAAITRTSGGRFRYDESLSVTLKATMVDGSVVDVTTEDGTQWSVLDAGSRRNEAKAYFDGKGVVKTHLAPEDFLVYDNYSSAVVHAGSSSAQGKYWTSYIQATYSLNDVTVTSPVNTVNALQELVSIAYVPDVVSFTSLGHYPEAVEDESDYWEIERCLYATFHDGSTWLATYPGRGFTVSSALPSVHGALNLSSSGFVYENGYYLHCLGGDAYSSYSGKMPVETRFSSSGYYDDVHVPSGYDALPASGSVVLETARLAWQNVSGVVVRSAEWGGTAEALVPVRLEVRPATSTRKVLDPEAERYTATVLYSNGTEKDVTYTCNWTLDGAPATYSVSAGNAVMTHHIEATYTENGTTLTGSATMEVTGRGSLVRLSMSPGDARTYNGGQIVERVTAHFSDGSTLDVTEKASYTISGDRWTMSNQGVFYAIWGENDSECTVTASWTYGGVTKSISAHLVNDGFNYGSLLAYELRWQRNYESDNWRTSPGTLSTGDVILLGLFEIHQYGDRMSDETLYRNRLTQVPDGILDFHDNYYVYDVDAVSEGSTTVTYWKPGGVAENYCRNTLTFDVTQTHVLSYELEVEPASSGISVGGTVSLSAVLYELDNGVRNGNSTSVTGSASWSAAHGGIYVTVSGGVVTGLRVTNTPETISAQYTKDGTTYTAEAHVTVSDITHALILEPAGPANRPVEIVTGSSQAFTAYYVTLVNGVEDPSLRVDVTSDAGCSWSSDNSVHLTVSGGFAVGWTDDKPFSVTLTAVYAPVSGSPVSAVASVRILPYDSATPGGWIRFDHCLSTPDAPTVGLTADDIIDVAWGQDAVLLPMHIFYLATDPDKTEWREGWRGTCEAGPDAFWDPAPASGVATITSGGWMTYDLFGTGDRSYRTVQIHNDNDTGEDILVTVTVPYATDGHIPIESYSTPAKTFDQVRIHLKARPHGYTFSLEVVPESATISPGGSQPFTATLHVFDGGVEIPSEAEDVTAQCTWTSSDPSVATMSGTASGLAEGVNRSFSDQTTTVTASFTGTERHGTAVDVSHTAQLTVTGNERPARYILEVTPLTASIASDGSQSFTAMLQNQQRGGTGLDAPGDWVNIGPSTDVSEEAEWTSSNPSAARMSTSVKGCAVGCNATTSVQTTNINASVERGGNTISGDTPALLSVGPRPMYRIVASVNPSAIAYNGTATASAALQRSDNGGSLWETVRDVTEQVSFHSSHAVVTVVGSILTAGSSTTSDMEVSIMPDSYTGSEIIDNYVAATLTVQAYSSTIYRIVTILAQSRIPATGSTTASAMLQGNTNGGGWVDVRDVTEQVTFSKEGAGAQVLTLSGSNNRNITADNTGGATSATISACAYTGSETVSWVAALLEIDAAEITTEYRYRVVVTPDPLELPAATGGGSLSATLQEQYRTIVNDTPGTWSDWTTVSGLTNEDFAWDDGGSTHIDVSEAGFVTGTNGSTDVQTATVTATYDGTLHGSAVSAAGQATVHVPAAVVLTSIRIDPASLTIDVGSAAVLQCIATYSDGSSGSVEASWQSTAPTVAAVDDSGVVTALSSGTSRITAGFGGLTAECEVTVHDVYVCEYVGLSLDPGAATLDYGEDVSEVVMVNWRWRLNAGGWNAEMSVLEDGYAWTMSGATGCVTESAGLFFNVNETGADQSVLVQATLLAGQGIETAYGSFHIPSGAFAQATLFLHPKPEPVYEYRVLVTPGSAVIPAGGTTIFTATLQRREAGSDGDWTDLSSAPGDFLWSSSLPESAQVSDGVVNGCNDALSDALTDIGATYQGSAYPGGQGVFGSAPLTVRGKVLVSIEVPDAWAKPYAPANTVAYGDQLDFICIARYDYGADVVVTDDAEWGNGSFLEHTGNVYSCASNDIPEIGTVSSFSVQYGGLQTSVSVTVYPHYVVSISVVFRETYRLSQNAKPRAELLYSDGTRETVQAGALDSYKVEEDGGSSRVEVYEPGADVDMRDLGPGSYVLTVYYTTSRFGNDVTLSES